MNVTENTNTCPKCGASILVNNMFATTTCGYCQSQFTIASKLNNTKFTTATHTTKAKKPHVLMGKFYSIIGLFAISLIIFLISALQLDGLKTSSFAYTLCLLGTFGGLLASIAFIIRASILAVKIVFGNNEA